MTARSPSTRLNLAIHPGPGALERIEAALKMADVAAVVVVPEPGRTLEAGAARVLVEALQRRDIAVLIADDARLARTLGADGVHLTPSADILARYRHAREIVGGRAIAGADAGGSRHEAMELGEGGADYVAFSIPRDAQNRESASTARLELVAWWAEIFEPPVVAFGCDTVEDTAALATARADFVTLAIPSDLTPAAVAGWLVPMLRALGLEAINA